MNYKLALAAIALVIVIALAGVWVWDNISKPPEVSVAGVDYRIDEKTSIFVVEIPTKVTLLLNVSIYNPNIIPITVTGADYRLYVNNVSVGNGSIKEPFVLEARSTTTVVPEISLSGMDALASFVDVFTTGKAKARVEGTVYVDIPLIGPQPITISQEKSL